MMPAPVAAEMRLALDAGIVPSLAWHFDAVCIVQSDIVGFTKYGATPPSPLS